MLPFRIVYHPGYDLNIGDHVFPSAKFRRIRERLLAEKLAYEEEFVSPEPATDEDLTLVHQPEWLRKLKTGTLGYMEILRLEIPYSQRMVEAFRLAAGGTTLAARLALSSRIAYNAGGGFHHAFPNHGEGFCAINDIAAAIRKLQQEKLVERAMVVDCDVHQGNGTAVIFANDPSVFTLSIHQLNNYPAEKPPSNVDINLEDNTGDREYLELLRLPLERALASFRPQLVIYVAGADPYEQDKLGGLSLTLPGLKARDRMVFDLCLRHRAPVAVTLAGGYALNVEDTVTIHINTVKAAMEALKETKGAPVRV
jgi:acetoin utilization deacetylase AcuC-like enzyme